MEGCLKLGMISSTKKNFEEGKENFRRALELAEQTNNKDVYDEAKFGYAVVAAEKGMNNFLGYYSSKLNRRWSITFVCFLIYFHFEDWFFRSWTSTY